MPVTASIVVGLALLTLGAEVLVRSASALAIAARVSPLVVGLTVVAFGTSAPELVVSVQASLAGQADIALGNVVGSNLFNIMGVLGFASLCSGDGIAVPASALRFDIPVMIAVAFACLPVFFTGHMIAHWEGAVLLAYYFVYTGYLVLAATNVAITRTFAGVMLGIALPLTAITLLVTVTRSWRGAAKVS